MKEEFPKIELCKRIWNIKSTNDFNRLCILVFNYQATANIVYQKYLKLLNYNINEIKEIRQIPYMPISFFKNHKIITGNTQPSVIFESSGTTGMNTSKHYVSDVLIYEESFTRCFALFYGNPSQYCFLALLPSYLERQNSSLVYMMNFFVNNSKYCESGFYINNYEDLIKQIKIVKRKKIKTILFGVSYALQDFSEKYAIDLDPIIVMETGGTKGRSKEITRFELHNILKNKFMVSAIHGEYGMTELLSQAYSLADGKYRTPPWMKVFIRDVNDPKLLLDYGKTGAINIIDLANINSCSFIATDDIGKLYPDGSFEVLGRCDYSDIRGCNLMSL